MTDNFTKAELKNRVPITNFLKMLEHSTRFDGGTLIEEPAEAKTRGDYYFTDGERKILVEVKARNYRSTAFSDWQCEGKKWNYLASQIGKDGVVDAYYVNSFTDGTFALGSIRKNPGKVRLSNPHKRYAVVDSEEICTEDRFLTLEEASFIDRLTNTNND